MVKNYINRKNLIFFNLNIKFGMQDTNHTTLIIQKELSTPSQALSILELFSLFYAYSSA